MDLVELDKQIKDKKILSVFKDGVADGLLYGVSDDKQTHHYYKLVINQKTALHFHARLQTVL